MNKDKMEMITIAKQATMKMESAIKDLYELKEFDCVSDSSKNIINQMIEETGTILGYLVHIVADDIDEEEFVNENIDMDEIDPYPDEVSDIMDNDIDH